MGQEKKYVHAIVVFNKWLSDDIQIKAFKDFHSALNLFDELYKERVEKHEGDAKYITYYDRDVEGYTLHFFEDNPLYEVYYQKLEIE